MDSESLTMTGLTVQTKSTGKFQNLETLIVKLNTIGIKILSSDGVQYIHFGIVICIKGDYRMKDIK